MVSYEQYSKEELIRKIEELEQRIDSLTVSSPSRNKLPDSAELRDFKTERGKDILDTLPDMLSIFDKNYNFIALVSSEKTVHVGGSSDNLIGKNLIDILPPDAYKPVKANFDKVIKTGQASVGFHNLYVEGALEHFENRVIPLDDQYLLCICRNISQRIQAQNQLEMVTSAVNNSVEEIYAVHPDGTLLFANKQFLKNYRLREEIGRYKIYDIYRECCSAEWESFLKRLRAAGGFLNYTCTHCQADNRTVPQEISSYILLDNLGNEIIWNIVRDMAERVQQENKIRELNQLLETILNNIPLYLFVKDSGNDFRYLYWNKTFEEISRIPASRVIGKTDEEIFPNPEDAKKFRKDDLHLLEKKEKIDFEENYITATGEKRIVHTIKTLVTPAGKQPLIIGISWDITDQKMTERELIEARNKAEESDKLKSAFLANMSHEIRTPLNAIVGFSKLMAETENSRDQAQYYDIISRNTDLLLQLINDILDLSKIEAGILEFVKKPVELKSLCRNLYDIHLPRTPKNVRLLLEEELPEITVISDANRLAQVLSNLLTNAQKFTSQGKISFGYKKKGNMIEFYVKDSGIGIAPANLGKIFDRFIKLDNFVQGTGLGLPICQMIVNNLGGRMWVESQPQQGSVFHFTVPATENTESGEKEENKAGLKPKKQTGEEKVILVAEDVDSNFLLLKALLGKTYALLHAQDGQEAVKLFREKSPDLILMDIKMPVMDGLEATRIIREESGEIPIIALTAFAFESDKTEALKAGCNDFLTKPIAATLLRQMIEKYI